jgi:hypothetical protein
MSWRQDRWFFLGIILLALAAYLPTLLTDISATNSPYFIDVGSIQDALSLGGTLHGSGYPLYAFTGAVFVALLRLIGVAPAAAASLYSTVWSIATLLMLYILLVDWQGRRWLALAVVGLFGLSWAFWLFSSYTEVYTFSLLFIVLALWCALRADRTGQTRYLYGLAICTGMSIAHARMIALTLPGPFLIAWPAFWQNLRQRRTFGLKWIGAVLLCGLLPYAYLLIRSWQPGAWIWGDPTTLEGFWRLMFGSAYTALISWPNSPEEWRALLLWVGRILLNLLTWPIGLLGAAGLIGLFVRRHYRYGTAFVLGAIVPFVMGISLQATFPGRIMDDIPMMLLPTIIYLLCGFVFLVSELSARWPVVERIALAACAVACGLSVIANQPAVYAMTHDETGRRIIADARQFLADNQFASPPAFFSPWGGEFWALSYGRDVTQEIPQFDLLPNRADVRQALDRYGVIHTFSDTFYNFGLDWWRKRLGPIRLSSSGVRTVAISTQPLLTEQMLPHQGHAAVMMGDAPLLLRDWQVKPLADDRWQVTLFWQATARPDRDYSVSVKATDRDVIDGPDDIVAQADSSAPVHGWYPTTLWSPGELVRDDYVIVLPPGRSATMLEVSLYTQDAAGNFQNFGRQAIPLR